MAASVGDAVAAHKWDGDGVPLAESNCAGIGTDEDKAARKAAAAGEPAWEGVGQAPGIRIWRIEDFQVVPYPEKEYGSFFSGDSYIIMHTYKVEDKLCNTIFFWLGRDTTADEMGTAAYKTVELDDLLDGEPAQSREVQGHESDDFKTLFKQIRYLDGGVATGFNQVSADTYEPRLCRCRRTKNGMRISQVTLARESLNHGDSFILDAGTTIYIWDGDECAPMEKFKANEAAEKLEGTREGKAKATHDIDDAFWAHLGGEGDIASAESASDDFPEPTVGEGVLYKIEDGSGDLKTTEVARGELTFDMLDTSCVMMLDTQSEIFLWIGSDASPGESRNAMRTAMNFLQVNEKPHHTPIHVHKEGTPITNATWRKIFH